MKALNKIKGLAQDHPKVITALLIVAVLVHAILTFYGLIDNTWASFLESGSTISVYLAACSVAAIVAGFAGVVVTFGLTASGERFRVLRASAGKHLGDNWASTSISGFTAAGLGLLAAILDASGLAYLGPWIFELSLLILIHGTVRVIWLLINLGDITGSGDKEAVERSQRTAVNDEYFS